MATAPQDTTALTEATLQLPPDALVFLREAAGERATSTGDMVRNAIALYRLLWQVTKAGGTVHYKDRNGKLFDVTI